MHPSMQRVAVAALALALALPARALVFRVDAASTSAVEDGSAANPYKTIQPAINAAVAGDQVVVAPGVYFGAVELKTDVPLVGEKGPAVTVIDGMGAFTAVVMPYDRYPRARVDGFTVRNADIAFYATNRVEFWGGATLAVSNVIVTGVRLGVEAYPASQVSVTKALFASLGQVMDSIWCSSPTFTNVTADGVTAPWGAFNMYQTGLALTNVVLSNSAAAFGTWGWYGSGYVWGGNNAIWNVPVLTVAGSSSQIPTVAWSAMEADPRYVNAAAGDFNLSAGSPLVDAGVDVGLPFFGAAPDIGAFESGLTIPGALAALAESYAAVPLPAYRNVGEQRRHALSSKIVALARQLGEISPDAPAADQLAAYAVALDKLENDIWAKADGFFGGSPRNDWITTLAEQTALKAKVDQLRDLIKAEMARLGA